MTDLPALKRQLIQDENAARARVNAVQCIECAVKELEAIGLRVSVYMSPNSMNTELLVKVNFDHVQQLGMERGAGDDRTVVQEVHIGSYGNIEVLAEGEIPIAACADDPEPDPIEPKTGPWTEHEEAEALELNARGQSAAEIGAALNRKPQGVAVKLRYLRGAAEKEAAAEEPSPPAAAPPPAAQTRPDPELSASQREVEAHLNALGYTDGWTPFADLLLVNDLSLGRKLQTISAKLDGLSVEDCKVRYRALTDGDTSLRAQRELLVALRRRAQTPSENKE